MKPQIGSSPMLSIVIPAYNSESTLERCLRAVLTSDYPNYECIVIDDSSKDGTFDKARESGVKVIRLTKGPFGPAYARNRGAEVASGEILFFIDSDVIIKTDTLAKIAESFKTRPDISALFGSYDERPESREFLSQYKNLLHHYVHQIGQEEASTFWSGCGAIKRDVFREFGGFDEKRFPRPSIEDIELGYRLKAAGHKILLRKDIQVTHLKNWTLLGLLKTDIWYRAIPWTLLILKYRNLPNDLNLQLSQRLSSFLLVLLLVHLGFFSRDSRTVFLPLLISLFLLTASGWQWSEEFPVFRFGYRKEKLAFLTISAMTILALIINFPYPLIAFIFLIPLLLMGMLPSKTGAFISHALLWAMMILFFVEFALLYASYPLLLTIPQLLILLSIVLLNYKLYLFFFKKRGFIFALYAIPLQLLYYFYSLVALVIGSIIHFLNLSLPQIQSRTLDDNE